MTAGAIVAVTGGIVATLAILVGGFIKWVICPIIELQSTLTEIKYKLENALCSNRNTETKLDDHEERLTIIETRCRFIDKEGGKYE